MFSPFLMFIFQMFILVFFIYAFRLKLCLWVLLDFCLEGKKIEFSCAIVIQIKSSHCTQIVNYGPLLISWLSMFNFDLSFSILFGFLWCGQIAFCCCSKLQETFILLYLLKFLRKSARTPCARTRRDGCVIVKFIPEYFLF